MIRPLRRRHLRLILGVGSVAGVLGLAGLMVRSPAALAKASTLDVVGASKPLRFAESIALGTVQMHDDGRVCVTLELDQGAGEQSISAYWVSGTESIGKDLPEDNIWLGQITGSIPRIFELPHAGTTKRGSIVLYSLSRQRVMDHASVEPPSTSSRGPT